MSTFVFLHAHPDDEAIGTAGTMAVLAQAGHRVVSLFATRGELGKIPADLGGHPDLGALREAEARRAGEILGAARVEFLGYVDSGDDAASVPPGTFAGAEVGEAAARLAELLLAEKSDALLIYDPTGVTGHPDHVQVHRVGIRAAAEVAGDVRVYEGTFSQSQLGRLAATAAALAASAGIDPLADAQTLFATPDADVTTTVDVRAWLGPKRAAMAAHASQIAEDSFFLSLRPEDFAAVFGWEHYIDRAAGGAGPGPLEAALSGAK